MVAGGKEEENSALGSKSRERVEGKDTRWARECSEGLQERGRERGREVLLSVSEG